MRDLQDLDLAHDGLQLRRRPVVVLLADELLRDERGAGAASFAAARACRPSSLIRSARRAASSSLKSRAPFWTRAPSVDVDAHDPARGLGDDGHGLVRAQGAEGGHGLAHRHRRDRVSLRGQGRASPGAAGPPGRAGARPGPALLGLGGLRRSGRRRQPVGEGQDAEGDERQGPAARRLIRAFRWIVQVTSDLDHEMIGRV